jgi:hypothetical protein
MYKTISLLVAAAVLSPRISLAADAAEAGADQLQQRIDDMQVEYDQRLQRLESRLQQTQAATHTKKINAFNPAVSLILSGNFTSYSNAPAGYRLPGFALSNEAGLATEGFSLGESELTLGANVDQNFYAQATFSLADNNGETSIDTEEAYFETIGLSHGLTLKAGRFYSAMGYLNGTHTHAWDFNDAPLVYRGLFGNQLKQDGAQLSWLLPTDTYLLVGGEVGNGVHFPSAGSHSGVGDWLVYANTGGDIGLSHSWQLGVSHWQANDVQDRTSQGLNSPAYSGDSRIDAIDAVYKWAPMGNPVEQNLKLQAEYFHRHEDGSLTLNDTAQTGTYIGSQNGWYAQAIYQFMPQWKTGLRYDRLTSQNTGSDNAVLDQAGLLENGHTPQRVSAMLAWQASEFSRIRVQFNRDESGIEPDNQFMVQYIMVTGAHGAHSY